VGPEPCEDVLAEAALAALLADVQSPSLRIFETCLRPPRLAAVPALSPTAAAVGVTVIGLLPVYLLGGLAVQVREELAVGRTGLGALVAAFFLGAAAGSLLGGRYADRLGGARVMRVTAGVGVLALLAVAASPGPCGGAAPSWR
jgi:MFS family permease